MIMLFIESAIQMNIKISPTYQQPKYARTIFAAMNRVLSLSLIVGVHICNQHSLNT